MNSSPRAPAKPPVPANLLVVGETPEEMRIRWAGTVYRLRCDARQRRWLLQNGRAEVMTYPDMDWIEALPLALTWIRTHERRL
jgi:hypothetical protein